MYGHSRYYRNGFSQIYVSELRRVKDTETQSKMDIMRETHQRQTHWKQSKSESGCCFPELLTPPLGVC